VDGAANTVANVIENYLHNPVVIIFANIIYLDWEIPLSSISSCVKNENAPNEKRVLLGKIISIKY